MGIHLAQQTRVFIQACVLGAALGVLYDIFRILRLAAPSPRAVVMAQDILFFMLCAALNFFFMLSTNDGQVRAFIIIGELIGALLQHLTLGVITMRLSKAIISLIKSVIGFIVRIIIKPVISLVAFLIRMIFINPARFLCGLSKKVAPKAKIRLKQAGGLLYNLCAGRVKPKKRAKPGKNAEPKKRVKTKKHGGRREKR